MCYIDVYYVFFASVYGLGAHCTVDYAYIYINIYVYMCMKGPFTCRLFSARPMIVTGKFRSPIGTLTHSKNRQLEFSSHSHGSRTKKAQCKRALLHLIKFVEGVPLIIQFSF